MHILMAPQGLRFIGKLDKRGLRRKNRIKRLRCSTRLTGRMRIETWIDKGQTSHFGYGLRQGGKLGIESLSRSRKDVKSLAGG